MNDQDIWGHFAKGINGEMVIRKGGPFDAVELLKRGNRPGSISAATRRYRIIKIDPNAEHTGDTEDFGLIVLAKTWADAIKLSDYFGIEKFIYHNGNNQKIGCGRDMAERYAKNENIDASFNWVKPPKKEQEDKESLVYKSAWQSVAGNRPGTMIERAGERLTAEAIQRLRERWDKEYPVHKSAPKVITSPDNGAFVANEIQKGKESWEVMRAINVTCANAIPAQAMWRRMGA